MLKLMMLFSFFAIAIAHSGTTGRPKHDPMCITQPAGPTFVRSHQVSASPKPRLRSIRSIGNVGHMGPVEILHANHHKIKPIPVARTVVPLSLVSKLKKYHASEPVIHVHENHPKTYDLA